MGEHCRRTIYDIAREAGVSPATVSRVISGSAEVSPDKRLRVERLVAKYDFHPNATARTLKTRTSMRVGVVVPDVSNPYYAGLYALIERRLSEYGYITTLCNSFSDCEKELRILHALERENVCAVLFHGVLADRVDLPAEQLQRFNRLAARTRMLSITAFPGAHCPALHVDEPSAIRDLAAHLVARGYRTFGFLGGAPGIRQTVTRRAFFRAALEVLGHELPERWVFNSGYDCAAGERSMQELLALPERPEAVFCFNDYVASGALRALHDAGLRVPEDMALAGSDDVFLASITHPPLTSLRPDYEAMTDAMLAAVLEQPIAPTDIAVRLIVRSTT